MQRLYDRKRILEYRKQSFKLVFISSCGNHCQCNATGDRTGMSLTTYITKVFKTSSVAI